MEDDDSDSEEQSECGVMNVGERVQEALAAVRTILQKSTSVSDPPIKLRES